MAESDRTSIDTLNEAAEAIGARLFEAGLDQVHEYARRYNIQESDIPLVMANAYLGVAIMTNASAFGLDADDLAERFNDAIVAAAKGAGQNGDRKG